MAQEKAGDDDNGSSGEGLSRWGETKADVVENTKAEEFAARPLQRLLGQCRSRMPFEDVKDLDSGNHPWDKEREAERYVRGKGGLAQAVAYYQEIRSSAACLVLGVDPKDKDAAQVSDEYTMAHEVW